MQACLGEISSLVKLIFKTMKNKKKAILGLGALSLALLTAGTVSAAANTNTSTTASVKNNQSAMARKGRPELTTEQKAAMEAKRSEVETKMTAVRAAITAGDYNAWVTAQKAIDEDCPLLTKITADNFSRYTEAQKLREQAMAIDKELGIEDLGRGGHERGMGLGLRLGKTTTEVTQ